MERRSYRALAAVLLIIIGAALGGCSKTNDDSLFEDTFDEAGSGWETGQYVEGAVSYNGGRYAIISNGDGNMMWGRLNDHPFEDVDIEVQAGQVTAPANNNNSFGIGCRLQPNSNDGYYLRISSDGYYAITKIASGVPTLLVDWAASPAIHQGATLNNLRAVCKGSTLTLYANSTQLASTSDDTFSSGDIALTATSFEAEPTEIHFDNITIRPPIEPEPTE